MLKKSILTLSTLGVISSINADQELIQLKKGWNLVGFPKPIYSARSVFSNEAFSEISSIYSYSNSSENWNSFVKGSNQRDLGDFDITTSDGVWVECNENFNLGFNLENATERKRSDNLNIKSNWNLISTPAKTTLSPRVFDRDSTVWAYSERGWLSFNSEILESDSASIKSLSNLDGYWVNSKKSRDIKINDKEAQFTNFSKKSNMNSYLKEMINLDIETDSDFSHLSATAITTTNLQEEDVDEDDIVKTNLDYLFYLNRDKNLVYAHKLDNLAIGNYEYSKISGVDGFNIDTLFLTDSKLILISKSDSQIALKFVDITTFEELESLKVDGDFITSRLIENSLYLISGFKPTLDESENIISPKIYSNEEVELYTPEKFYAPIKMNQQYKTISLIKVDLSDLTLNNSTILGDTYTQYVSKDSIYLVSLAYPLSYSMLDFYPRSIIYKFSTSDLTFKGSIFIDGDILNQFSLSESNDILRVASYTKSNSSNLWEDETFLYTIVENNKTLEILDSISIGENLTEVRFLENSAFFTLDDGKFYAVDLSDSKNIKKAENIFEFSAISHYFHPIGEDRLLSIGRDLDENMLPKELNIKLFDSSNIEEIKLLDSYSGDWEKSDKSEAEDNHKAFTMSSEKIFSLPILNNTESLYVAKIEDDKINYLTTIESNSTSEVDNRGIIFTHSDKKFVAFVIAGAVKVEELK